MLFIPFPLFACVRYKGTQVIKLGRKVIYGDGAQQTVAEGPDARGWAPNKICLYDRRIM